MSVNNSFVMTHFYSVICSLLVVLSIEEVINYGKTSNITSKSLHS